jgi:hypothetical protein
MWRTLAWGALGGGAVAWIWGAISWGVLPWHHGTFRSFANEDEAVRAFLALSPRSGVYGLPSPPRHGPSASPAERAAADRAAQQRMSQGPIVTAIVRREGFGSVPLAMLRAFIIYAIAAGLLTWLLMQTSGLTYWERAQFAVVVGAAAGAICRLPDWNWHGYSAAYTLVAIADHVIATSLVGLLVARFTE